MFLPEGVAEGMERGLEAARQNTSREANIDYNKRMLAMQEAKREEEAQGREFGGEATLKFLTESGAEPSMFVAPPNAPDGSEQAPKLIQPPTTGQATSPPRQAAAPAPGAQAMMPGQSSVMPPQAQPSPPQVPKPRVLPGQGDTGPMDVWSYAKWFKQSFPEAKGSDFMNGLSAMMPVFDQRSKAISEMLKVQAEERYYAQIRSKERMDELKLEETKRRDDQRHEAEIARVNIAQQNADRLNKLMGGTLAHLSAQNAHYLEMEKQGRDKIDETKEFRQMKKDKEAADKKLFETTDSVKLNNANIHFSGGKASETTNARGKEGLKIDLEAKEKMFDYLKSKGYEDEQIIRERNTNAALLPALKASIANLQKREGMVAEGTREFKYDVDTLVSVLDKVGNIPPQAINEPLNWFKKKLSDTDFGILQLGMYQLGTKYEKVLSGSNQGAAQLHVASKEQAQQMLSANMSISEVKAKLPMMCQELDNADNAYQKVLQEHLDKIPDITKMPVKYPPGTVYVGKNPDGVWEFADKDRNILKRIK